MKDVGTNGRRKVVVIDDSAVALEVVRAGLEQMGFDVVALNSPIGSAIIVGRESPDAVLVDLMMASMTGEAVVKGLKARAGQKAGAVLLFSDKGERDLADAAKRSGAD